MKHLILVLLALLLTGCALPQNWSGYTAYRDMEYTRPDMEQLRHAGEEACRLAAEAETVTELMDSVWTYYDLYDQFFTLWLKFKGII